MDVEVTCGQCGTSFIVDSNKDSQKREPCPNCGSIGREIYVTSSVTVDVSSTLKATVSVKVTKIIGTVNLLLQSVVVPGEKTDEGRLVEAVSIPWFKIIELLTKDPSIAYSIRPRKWEEIVAGAYKKAGFDEVTLTPSSGDRGRDVIAIKKGIGRIRIIDQVKAYKPGHLVTAKEVRALVGVLRGDKASKGFLTTTSDFAPKLAEDPLITPLIPAQLELINGVNLIRRLEELSKT